MEVESCGKCGAPRGAQHAPMCDSRSLRYNAGKTRWSLFPFDAAAEIVKVLMFGAKKYAVGNWQKGTDWTETYDSTIRHLVDWRCGKDYDEDSKCLVLAHAGCNILFLIWYQIRKVGRDDRQLELPLKEMVDASH